MIGRRRKISLLRNFGSCVRRGVYKHLVPLGTKTTAIKNTLDCCGNVSVRLS